MLDWVTLALCFALAGSTPDSAGVIEGTVVNGSRGHSPIPAAAVVLRAQHRGAWMPIAETVCDNKGQFRFEGLPLEKDLVCLTGANFQGIHYPGRRVAMDAALPRVPQTIVVYETVADSNPLVGTSHEIDIRAEAGVLVVTETIVVANRSSQTYVGPQTPEAESAATLRLSIPSEFEKVTFAKEFFGRQFQLNNERLETQIPWTPGQRELKFTYRLPLEHRNWSFRRPLDLPTEKMRLKVRGAQLQDVYCSLPFVRKSTDDALVFESESPLLPRAHAIELQFGDLPVPWMIHARWFALAALVLLVLLTWGLLLRVRGAKMPKSQDSNPHEVARAA
jgi:hypothetical protein